MPGAPHFAYPFAFVNGKARTVEQGTDAEVRGVCVRSILLYPLGSRPLVPEFGVEDQSFDQVSGTDGPDLDELRSAIAASEPRADTAVSITDRDLTELAQGVAHVRLGVSVLKGE
jgi:phage baseplate assembly protein W